MVEEFISIIHSTLSATRGRVSRSPTRRIVHPKNRKIRIKRLPKYKKPRRKKERGIKPKRRSSVQYIDNVLVIFPDALHYTMVSSILIGTTTIRNPNGALHDQRSLSFRFSSVNIVNLIWQNTYRGGATLALPTSTTGGSKTDYFGFYYNQNSLTWDLLAASTGY